MLLSRIDGHGSCRRPDPLRIGDFVKALSVKEPWASLIASGQKTIETRRWRTSYRLYDDVFLKLTLPFRPMFLAIDNLRPITHPFPFARCRIMLG